jgi:hypothetical protein
MKNTSTVRQEEEERRTDRTMQKNYEEEPKINIINTSSQRSGATSMQFSSTGAAQQIKRPGW